MLRGHSAMYKLAGCLYSLCQQRVALAAPSAGAIARAFSDDAAASSSSSPPDMQRRGLVNKLLYRSRQRGFLELDLIMGLWAEKEVPRMPADMLQHFSAVLDMENPDLFKWLTGQQTPPPAASANPAFQALSKHVQEQLGQSAQQAAKAPAGKEWVRGWDDSWAKKPGAAGEAQASH